MRKNARTVVALATVGLLALPASVSAAAAPEPEVPEVAVRVALSPDFSDVYGVGQLVTARFGMPVTNKADVERAITISADVPLGAGSWGWVDDRTAVYRPRKFWPANAEITFEFALKGVELAHTDEAIYVGARDKSLTLQTGRRFVMDIRDSKHRLFVVKNGKRVKSFPVSLGKPGWETRSGVKILTGEKYVKLRMTGYDPGAKTHWDVVAPYSIRLTPTGEFIHGAPWAAYRMGKANGSHGCTNMFPRDAKWLYKRVIAGDPVVTRGTGRPMTTDNGVPGAYWNFTWKQWQAKSALPGAPRDVTAQKVAPPPIQAGP